MPHGTTALFRGTIWLMLALGAVYVITLVPGIGPDGWSPAIDGWLNMTVYALVIVVLALRTIARPQGPGGLAVHDRGARGRLLRQHGVSGVLPVRRARPDLLVVGRRVPVVLPAPRDRAVPAAPREGAAPAVQPLPRRPDRRPDRRRAGRDVRAGRRDPARRAAHRLAGGGLPGRRPAAPGPRGRLPRRPRQGRRRVLVPALRLLRHLLPDRHAVRGRGGERPYVGGGPIDAGWLIARLLLVAAALVSLRAEESRTVDLEGASVLVLPGLCGLAVLGLLFDGTVARDQPVRVGRRPERRRAHGGTDRADVPGAAGSPNPPAGPQRAPRRGPGRRARPHRRRRPRRLRPGAGRRGPPPRRAAQPAARARARGGGRRGDGDGRRPRRHRPAAPPALRARDPGPRRGRCRTACKTRRRTSSRTPASSGRSRSGRGNRCRNRSASRPTGSPGRPWSTPGSTHGRAPCGSPSTQRDAAWRCTSRTTAGAWPRRRRPAPAAGTRVWWRCATVRWRRAAGGGPNPGTAAWARRCRSSCRCPTRPRPPPHRPRAGQPASSRRTTPGAPGTATTNSTQHAPAQQTGEITGDPSLEQVGRSAGGQQPGPRRGVRLS